MAGLQKSPNSIQTIAELDFPGGPIPLDSPFYIDRSGAEALACAEISKPGGLVPHILQVRAQNPVFLRNEKY